jgi:hypothetical protein
MIWSLARQMDIPEDVLRDNAQRISGKRSLRALSVSQAARLIDQMQGKRQQSETRATDGQLAVIRDYARKLGWEDPKRLHGWILSRYGVERLEWLRSEQASLCIEALKAMLKGGRGERKQYTEQTV